MSRPVINVVDALPGSSQQLDDTLTLVDGAVDKVLQKGLEELQVSDDKDESFDVGLKDGDGEEEKDELEDEGGGEDSHKDESEAADTEDADAHMDFEDGDED